jgi:hypothetical protein
MVFRSSRWPAAPGGFAFGAVVTWIIYRPGGRPAEHLWYAVMARGVLRYMASRRVKSWRKSKPVAEPTILERVPG